MRAADEMGSHENLGEYDCIQFVTDHSGYDHGKIVADSQLVLDTRMPPKGAGAKRLSTADQHRQLLRRHLSFLLFVVGSLFVFWKPLSGLISFSLTHDYGSHIILVAPVSAYIIYRKRREIFSKLQSGLLAGSMLFLAGAIFYWFSHRRALTFLPSDYESAEILAMVVLWMSGFVLAYGAQAFARARFPLLFLLFLVPIPDFLLHKVIFLLQAGSAEVAYWLLRLLNVPVFKQGFTLQLPTLTVEVAEQCSGIRSSLALLITTLLVGEFVLRSAWRKSVLVASIVPILILKNGVRIVAVSLLTIYVDRGFLHGWLHTSGGIVFYVLGLVILIPILVALRNSEKRYQPAFPVVDASQGEAVTIGPR
jgi:exosortase